MAHIIIAEDDPVASRILSVLLQSMNKTITLVTTGDELFQHLKRNTYDLALVDYRLPDYSGLEIVKHIKQTYASLPVVIQSAYVTDKLEQSLKSAGAAEIIEKPLSRAIVKDVLARHIQD